MGSCALPLTMEITWCCRCLQRKLCCGAMAPRVHKSPSSCQDQYNRQPHQPLWQKVSTMADCCLVGLLCWHLQGNVLNGNWVIMTGQIMASFVVTVKGCGLKKVVWKFCNYFLNLFLQMWWNYCDKLCCHELNQLVSQSVNPYVLSPKDKSFHLFVWSLCLQSMYQSHGILQVSGKSPSTLLKLVVPTMWQQLLRTAQPLWQMCCLEMSGCVEGRATCTLKHLR